MRMPSEKATGPTAERASASPVVETPAPETDVHIPGPIVAPAIADFEDAEGGIQLAELARAAAMQAEREAIQRALARFRWNRRKAAAYLNVSYKTLLNKMRECGISEAGAP